MVVYKTCWSKAFGFSCATHFLFILLLSFVLGRNLDSRPLPEQYITLEWDTVAEEANLEIAPFPPGAAVNTGDSVPALDRPVKAQTKPAAAYDDSSLGAGRSSEAGESMASAVFAGSGTANPKGADSSGIRTVSAGGSDTQTVSSGRAEAGGDINGIVNAFLSQIEKRKIYPYMARRLGQQGTVAVSVQLSADGELAGVQVLRSSGVAALDEAALALVRKVCPFPHHAGRAIAMNIPIAYHLE